MIIDPLHFDRGPNTLEDLKKVPKDCWRYRQLCDGTKNLKTQKNYFIKPLTIAYRWGMVVLNLCLC